MNKKVIIKLKVFPCAKKNKIIVSPENIIKVRITAPAEDGKANKALIRLLSEKLNISKSNIDIIRGQTYREKLVCVSGLSKKDVTEKLV